MDSDRLQLLDQLIAKRNQGRLTPDEEVILQQLLTLLFSTDPEVITAETTLATAGSIDAALAEELKLQLAESQTLLQAIKDRNKDLNQIQEALIKRRLNQILRQNIIKNISQKRLQEIKAVTSQKAETDPEIVNTQAAQAIVTAVAAQIDPQNTSQLTPEIIDQAATVVAQELAAGEHQTSQTTQASAIVTLAALNPDFAQLPVVAPLHEYARQLEHSLTPTSQEEEVEALINPKESPYLVDPAQNAKAKPQDLDHLAKLSLTIPESALVVTPQLELPENEARQTPVQEKVTDALKKTTQVNEVSVLQIKSLPPDTATIESGKQNKQAALTILHEVYRQNPDLRPNTTPAAAEAAGAFRAMGLDNLATATNFYGRGIRQDHLDKAFDNLPSEAKRKFAGFYGQVRNQVNLISRFHKPGRPNLGSEISPLTKASPLSHYINRFSTFTNNPAVSNFIRIAGNPMGALRNYLVEQAGKTAGKAIGKVLIKAGLEKAGQTLVQEGLKQGLKIVGEELLKKGATAAAAFLGSLGLEAAAGPPGWVLAAIQLALAALSLAWKIGIKPLLNRLSQSLTGQEFDEKAAFASAAALPVAAVGVTAAGLSAAIAAISLTFLSPFIFAAIIGGFVFFWIPTINIAPLISTLVHLDSTPGSQLVNPGEFLEPGELSESCPTGYPSGLRHLSQGPNTGTHQIDFSINVINVGTYPSQHQAVDFGGGPTPVFATHTGQAYAFPLFTRGLSGFGNFVIILAECNNAPYITVYAHLTSASLPQGGPTPVTKGQTIGVSGDSGSLGDGNHLHYEIISKGQPFNILNWISR